MDKRTKVYLTNKQRGGEVNQRGNDYELTFACYRILQFVVRHSENLQRIIFSSQCQGFIDDLFIEVKVPGNEKDLFHQLKTSQVLNWGNGEGSLSYDFDQQGKMQKKRNKPYHTYLVVSNDGVYLHMRRRIPRKLRKYVSIEKFPWFGSLNAHCAYHLQFRQLAAQLCAFQDTDKLDALVKCIYACWGATDKKNIPLSQILNCVRGIGYAYLKSTLPMILRDRTAAILQAIPGFRFNITGGYFYWTFSNTDRGQSRYLVNSPEFRNIENEIIAENPATFNDLELIISSI